MQQSNIELNEKTNGNKWQIKGESDQIKAAKIATRGTIIAAILGLLGTIGGTFLGKVLQSNKDQIILNQTFYEIVDSENGNVTLDEIKQDYIKLKRDYEIISGESEILNDEKENMSHSLIAANNTIEELQAKLSIKDQEIKALNDKISGMYDVDFQNLNLTINGIESGYNDRTATINNETFYSIGFMKYLVDNQAVSSDGVRIFIGDVQSEDMMPVSLFYLTPFTNGRLEKTTNEEDNYGNTYEEVFKVLSRDIGDDQLLDDATEYFINGNFSTFCFETAFSSNAIQNFEYEILILGDGRILKSVVIDRKTKTQSIEVNIINVEFLQIVGRCSGGWNHKDIYSLIIDPYLYP